MKGEDLILGTQEEFIRRVKEWMASFSPPVSQGSLARMIDQQPQHVSKWMQGKVNPSPKNREKIIECLEEIQRLEGT